MMNCHQQQTRRTSFHACRASKGDLYQWLGLQGVARRLVTLWQRDCVPVGVHIATTALAAGTAKEHPVVNPTSPPPPPPSSSPPSLSVPPHCSDGDAGWSAREPLVALSGAAATTATTTRVPLWSPSPSAPLASPASPVSSPASFTFACQPGDSRVSLATACGGSPTSFSLSRWISRCGCRVAVLPPDAAAHVTYALRRLGFSDATGQLQHPCQWTAAAATDALVRAVAGGLEAAIVAEYDRILRASRVPCVDTARRSGAWRLNRYPDVLADDDSRVHVQDTVLVTARAPGRARSTDAPPRIEFGSVVEGDGIEETEDDDQGEDQQLLWLQRCQQHPPPLPGYRCDDDHEDDAETDPDEMAAGNDPHAMTASGDGDDDDDDCTTYGEGSDSWGSCDSLLSHASSHEGDCGTTFAQPETRDSMCPMDAMHDVDEDEDDATMPLHDAQTPTPMVSFDEMLPRRWPAASPEWGCKEDHDDNDDDDDDYKVHLMAQDVQPPPAQPPLQPPLCQRSRQQQASKRRNKMRRVYRTLLHSSPLGYINANHVRIGHNVVHRFLACQAPLPHTMATFWAMLWQQRCTIVVCLTRTLERGRRKADPYWPTTQNPLMCHGPFQVRLARQQVQGAFVLRTLDVRVLIGGRVTATHRLTHVHFVGWPDHGVPVATGGVLQLIQAVSLMAEAHQHRVHAKAVTMSDAGGELLGDGCGGGGGGGGSVVPIAVHCSAGIGRAGTFIAAYHALALLREARAMPAQVHVASAVAQARRCRNGMVQTRQQYCFVYQLCNDYLVERAFQQGFTCLDPPRSRYQDHHVHCASAVAARVTSYASAPADCSHARGVVDMSTSQPTTAHRTTSAEAHTRLSSMDTRLWRSASAVMQC